jgi:uncharacterized repeat protein (TIGR03803 family)
MLLKTQFRKRPMLALGYGTMLVSLLTMAPAQIAHGHDAVTTLHIFNLIFNPNDGGSPNSLNLGAGGIFGVAETHGSGDSGTAFKITSSGVFSILHSFSDGTTLNDGIYPRGLVLGSDANYYGFTVGDGSHLGAIFRMTPAGAVTILHRFGDGTVPLDGRYPTGQLLETSPGVFYGTTGFGGGNDSGTIFRITSGGSYSLLHSFNDGSVPNDGIDPMGITKASDGNFYGVTFTGGLTSPNGQCGVVFRFTPAGAYSIVRRFHDGSVVNDGSFPNSGLLEGADGNFYGTTVGGGAGNHGSIFKMTKTGVTTILHSFVDISDPGDTQPTGPLLLSQTGMIYGTSYGGPGGAGVIYQISPSGAYSYKHVFQQAPVTDTRGPIGGVIEGSDGSLYGAGVTSDGFYPHDTVYKVAFLADPTVAQISPSSVPAGHAPFTLTVTGTNFFDGATIYWNGTALTTTLISSTQLSAQIPTSSVAVAGTASVTVGYRYEAQTPAQTLTITHPAAPTLTAISPNVVQVGHYGFTLTATGTNFDTSVAIYWNGTALPTTVVSGTQITAAIPASAVATPGTVNITVGYPLEPQSAALPLTITPASTLASLSPNTVQAGSNDFTFAVNGTNFTPSSQVVFSGAYITTHYVTPTQLTATVPRGYLATPGTINVSVNSAGVSPTAPLPFTVTGPAVPARCAPSTVQAGHASFNLSIVGTGFTSSTKAFWNGTLLTTYFISTGQIVATVPAAFVAAPTTATITVTPTTPATTPISFPVTAAPTFTGMTPSTTTAGHADFTLTTIGTGFVVGAQITWNGTPLTTTYVSPTNLTATIPAALVTSAGTATLKVINPGVAPTGPRTFTITP